MKKIDLGTRLLFLTACLSFALLVPHARAQSPALGPTVGIQGGKYGIGLTSSWPAFGISGTMQLNEKITAEALIGAVGSVSNFGARGWYRFDRREKFDIYGFAALGLYRYSGTFTENVLGIGGGAGLEWSLQKVIGDDTLPPLFFHIELGLAFAGFDAYSGFSTFGGGGGLHYRFGR